MRFSTVLYMVNKVLPILMISALITSVGCHKKKAAGPAMPQSYPVRVAEVVRANVPVIENSFGTLISPNTINLIAQVSGQLIHVNFQEGSYVKKDELLLQIDPSIYIANLEIAKANLLRDQASLVFAVQTLESYSKLIEGEFVAELTIDQYKQNVEQAKAAIASDEANIKLSEINLGYTELRAPIDGAMGFLQVNEGNFITAGSSNAQIAQLQQIAPIYALFPLPERYLWILRENQAKGPLKVTATFEDDSGKVLEGEIFAINNSVDVTTGTISVKAVFKNTDLTGWPGQFVRTKTKLYTVDNAKLVPATAVQAGQKGNFVYVVQNTGTVEQRQVVTGETLNEQIVIKSGLDFGELVVTDGQLNLYAGAPVTPTEELPLSNEVSA